KKKMPQFGRNGNATRVPWVAAGNWLPRRQQATTGGEASGQRTVGARRFQDKWCASQRHPHGSARGEERGLAGKCQPRRKFVIFGQSKLRSKRFWYQWKAYETMIVLGLVWRIFIRV